jgi:hypothetical protein
MRRPGSPWPAVLTAGLLLLIAVPAAPAQPKPPFVAFREGTEVFRRILFERGFHPLESFNELDEHTILIVFGDGRQLTGGVRSFVDRGGALFLATDKALPRAGEDALTETAGVRVTGRSVICKDADSCYHGLDYCPFLLPIRGENPDLFRNLTPQGASVSTVASNAPSYLERAARSTGKPFLLGLASLPDNCSLEGVPNQFQSPPLFAVGGNKGKGRVLVLADHSIFINEMMLPPDNGNVEFTYNCLEWLRGDAKEGRTKVLFVEDGKVNPRFNVPLKEMPDELVKRLLEYLRQHPDEAAKLALNIVAHYPRETAKLALDAADAADKTAQKIAPEAERSLQEFDERDGFNDGLVQMFADKDGSADGLLRSLAVWLAVLVVLYGCYKIGWKARHRTDLQGPLLSVALYRLDPADTVVEQRRRDLIRGDNLWEPARDLARQCLAASGLPAAAVPPRVVVQGGWLRQWTMTGRVRRLWRLAYGPPTRISLSQWQRLLREAQQVMTALASGAVALSPLSPVLRGEGGKKS